MSNKLNHQLIIDICDRLIEDAQEAFMSQEEKKNTFTFALKKYTSFFVNEALQKEIIAYLLSQEIRLYEDVSDENGEIISSEEKHSNIFEDIHISGNPDQIIHVAFSRSMMELLDD